MNIERQHARFYNLGFATWATYLTSLGPSCTMGIKIIPISWGGDN